MCHSVVNPHLSILANYCPSRKNKASKYLHPKSDYQIKKGKKTQLKCFEQHLCIQYVDKAWAFVGCPSHTQLLHCCCCCSFFKTIVDIEFRVIL